MVQRPPPTSSVTGSISIPIRSMDYIDSQNKQNDCLNQELCLLRGGQERTNDKHDGIEKRLEKRFDAMIKKLDGFSARQEQWIAVFRNSLLSNPTIPIQPVITFDPVKGRCHPDPLYFPKHADEFYALREMDSMRKKQQLIYLTDFYELVPPNSEYIVKNPFDTVSRLETVLGLQEDRFIRFRERAQKHTNRPPVRSIKRTHSEYTELGHYLIPVLEALANSGKSSSLSVYTRVEWDTNPLPANKRPRRPLAPTESVAATAAPATPTPAELDDLDAPTSAQPRLLSESTSAPPTDPTAPA